MNSINLNPYHEDTMKHFLYLLLPIVFLNLNLIAQESEDESANEIEEVVVTATSRETSIFEVPYNISAVSGSDIDSKGILDTAELLRSFAGISTIDRGSRNAGTVNNIRIRGGIRQLVNYCRLISSTKYLLFLNITVLIFLNLNLKTI